MSALIKFALSQLLEFDDPKNRGVYDGRSEVIEYPMKKLTWKREVIDNTSVVAISFVSSLAPSNGSQSRDGASLTGGIIKITLAAYANGGFGKWLPHLSHSHKTNQFDIELQNVTTNSGFNFSRFGIEMVLVASLNSSIKDERRIRHTNDDEHTPGTFEVGFAAFALGSNLTMFPSFSTTNLSWLMTMTTTFSPTCNGSR